MDHVVEYVVKGSRPQKPIVILWGNSPEMARLFRRAADLYTDQLHAGTIKAHVTTQPLFADVSTLWVVGTPETSLLKILCQNDIVQPVIFESVTKNDPPELEGKVREKVKLLSISDIKPGTKPHKHVILWFLQQEFPAMEVKILETLVEVSSPHFSKDILFSLDCLAQRIYLLPPEDLLSVTALKRLLMTISAEQWLLILHPKETAIINGFLDKFFGKSRTAYVYLDSYYQNYDSPLPLLKALATKVEQYLECNWAISEVKGRDGDAATFVQGRKISRAVLTKYQERAVQFFGKHVLWTFAQEISLTQARYRAGLTSKLPMYTLIGRYIGAGI